MNHQMKLGKSDLHVPRMGIGAMVWGQPKGMARWTPAQLAYGPSHGTAEEEEALKVSLDAGVDLIDTAAAVARSRSPGEPLVLDEALGRRSLPADGDLLLSLRLLLELREVDYVIGPATAGKLEPRLDGARTALIVFAQPYDRDLERRFRIERVEERGTGRYGLYRLERR